MSSGTASSLADSSSNCALGTRVSVGVDSLPPMKRTRLVADVLSCFAEDVETVVSE